MSEDFGVECVSCREIFGEVKNCPICDSSVCSECATEQNNLLFEEWLDDCQNKCDKCKRIGCRNCISTCFQCWNEGDEYNFLCQDCSDLTEQDCEYHSYWTLCPKHYKEECCVCKANKNYSRYDSFC